MKFAQNASQNDLIKYGQTKIQAKIVYDSLSDYLSSIQKTRQKNKSPPPINNCSNDGHGYHGHIRS